MPPKKRKQEVKQEEAAAAPVDDKATAKKLRAEGRRHLENWIHLQSDEPFMVELAKSATKYLTRKDQEGSAFLECNSLHFLPMLLARDSQNQVYEQFPPPDAEKPPLPTDPLALEKIRRLSEMAKRLRDSLGEINFHLNLTSGCLREMQKEAARK